LAIRDGLAVSIARQEKPGTAWDGLAPRHGDKAELSAPRGLHLEEET
jgi:hypothetical protein